MPNTLLTPSVIAKEAIMVLQNQMVFAGLVHRDFSDEFANVGDTVTVRKPATFSAEAWNGSTVNVQAASEGSVAVKMDKVVDVSFAVTSKELALSIKDFSEQFIQPAMRAHAQYLDSLLAGLYVDIPYFASVSQTPVIGDIAGIATVMNNNKAPLAGRNLVLDPTTYAKYVVLDAVLHAEKSGSTQALRDASMGKVLGFDSYMDQNVKAHTTGTGQTIAIDNATGYLAGETDLHIDGLSAALKVGDIIKLNNVYYLVVEADALSTADQDIVISPGLAAAATNDDVITVHGGGAQNLAFHKNAFALVTRPLAAPFGAARAETLSFNGVSVRVVYDYNMNTKTDTISLDFLCGVKTLSPELACRFLG